MQNQQKSIRGFSILSAVLTCMWIVLSILSMSDVNPGWTLEEFAEWASRPGIFLTLNYINASALTAFVVILFSLLFGYLFQKYRNRALIALVFVPVYGVLNMACYSIQISIVPQILRNTIDSPDTAYISYHLIQASSRTLVGFLNGLAYAILGIPSIIFGKLLMGEKKRFSGLFLIINGVFCLIGIVGYLMDSSIVSMGIMAGGIFFLISLVFMAIEFNPKVQV